MMSGPLLLLRSSSRESYVNTLSNGHTRPSHRPRYQLTRGLRGLDNEKDAMTSGCLDRKEIRGAIWGVHSTTDRPAGGKTGRLFPTFGGPVCADRFSKLSIG